MLNRRNFICGSLGLAIAGITADFANAAVGKANTVNGKLVVDLAANTALNKVGGAATFDGASLGPIAIVRTSSATNGFAVLTYVGSTKSKKRYRIVSLTSTSVLVQSLDSDIPQANDVFIQTKNITNNFTAITVGLPNFDKFSGQLMYIDNKQGFTPSSDETITLRTIIRF